MPTVRDADGASWVSGCNASKYLASAGSLYLNGATYTGTAQLWQGETVIKAPSLIIDSKNGQGVVPFLSLDQLQKRKEEPK